ncbi:MAG: AAA family ATPase, partial [Acidobacteriaceae bacterium]|nr:AAA family ATPase [Acidobacteriaceae bacterium]
VRLTGFGLASRLLREHQAPDPPELFAGTLAYMAPEQTGRMNRSIDSRSGLYSLGVTFYEMTTGTLPFTASDPMEWVHSHIARHPEAPADRMKTIPRAVSAVIMKLLAKAAEDRYQTAAGLESDLRRCLAAWQERHEIEDFPLGERDIPSRLLIPEKLYGREREIETLLATFDRVVKGGAPELVLVSGYSGIGKSSVVNELHKVLVPPRGLFASGKFDQYKRDIPYSTLVQAFAVLVRALLCKTEEELARWRQGLREALDPNGRLMVDLVPELKHIIGEQPPVPDLPPQQAQSRFQLVFARFIGVFAKPEHPLALFLDDLQWLDAATLDLLEDLLKRVEFRNLVMIGAYRDNEVDANHPLMRKLEAIRNAGVAVHEMKLSPLAREHVAQLIAEALHSEAAESAPLAELVHGKTGGNPFFTIHFLYALTEEKLLCFDHKAGRWSWNLDAIHAKGYTDNVVDLMSRQITRLPAETQHAVQQLACLGNAVDSETFSIIAEASQDQVATALWPALRLELVEYTGAWYRFVHDRVREAAYSSIPEEQRPANHLRIGRILLSKTPEEKRDEAIFDIVDHLNRGARLIDSSKEREQLAELNLRAGKRAKASTAYGAALNYLTAGSALVGEDCLLRDDCWERLHDLIFALEMNRAECEFLTGSLDAADDRLARLAGRTANVTERAAVACLRIDVCTTLDESSRAVTLCLDHLRAAGIDWPPHPTDEDVRHEYERIWAQLGDRQIEDLVHLPVMDDPESLATLAVLMKVYPAATFTDPNLPSLAMCRTVSISLERGHSDASCYAYVLLPRTAGPRFGDYTAGFRFAQLGYDLVQQRGFKRFEASTVLCFAIFTLRWIKPVSASRDLLDAAFETANRIGDLTWAAFSRDSLNSTLLFEGDPLPEVQGEAEKGFAFARNARFGLVMDFITNHLALISTLRGLTPKFGCLGTEQTDELRMEEHLSGNPMLALALCWYWVRKLQARYLAGDYAAAMEASASAQPLLWTSTSFLEEAEYHFYSALVRAALWDSADASARSQHAEALNAHLGQLKTWAEHCPENFENRVALVGAEIARMEGRNFDAMSLYQQAIRAAHANGFTQNEAVANELASRFYAALGFEDIAHFHLLNARTCYASWGADGKVKQLEEQHPELSQEHESPDSKRTMSARVEHLELATVLVVSQAVSGEIVMEKLVETLLRTAIEQAGAERGVLILSRGEELRIQAEAHTSGSSVAVSLRDAPVSAEELPESFVRYAARTQENVVVNDASAPGPFCEDAYIRRKQARSILCLPLVKQSRLVALLYLENNLTTGAFTPQRTSVLKVLASAAAMSLENSRLYRELEQREANLEATRAEIQALNERLFRSQEEERSRIARELHDDLSQQLAALSLKVSGLDSRLAGCAPEVGRETVMLRKRIADAVATVRQISHELHPGLLEQVGLRIALKAHCEQLSSGAGTPIVFDSSGLTREPSAPVRLCLFRIAQEALQNASKHAPESRVEVRLTEANRRVILTIHDNGPGFDPNRIIAGHGLGLLSMRERARLVDGSWRIESVPGQGTTVVAEVPVE